MARVKIATQDKPLSTTADTPGAVYQLKIGIADSKPLIWRRVLVVGQTPLSDLHAVIQAIMGWENSHLHHFEAPGPGETSLKTGRSRRTSLRFVPRVDPLGEPFDWMDDDESGDEAEAFLNVVAPTVKNVLLYTYDMGDNWEHDILVENILLPDPDGLYPICIAGERNGPLEDCGGIWGYEALLEAIAAPSHPDHKELKTWLRDAFGVRTWDGEKFDIEAINKKLARLRPKGKRAVRRRKEPAPES